jgi:TolA-binding protein
MNKYLITLIGFFLIAAASAADKAPPTSEPSFFDRLRMKLERITPQKKISATTAVGGVRGAPVESTDVYWKGEAKPVDAGEVAAFQKAMALVDEGKKDQAQAAFADFTKKYPDSPLRKDAEQAQSVLLGK